MLSMICLMPEQLLVLPLKEYQRPGHSQVRRRPHTSKSYQINVCVIPVPLARLVPPQMCVDDIRCDVPAGSEESKGK